MHDPTEEMETGLLVRTALRCSQEPEFLGYWLRLYRETEGLEPAALARHLGGETGALDRLSLCLRPAPENRARALTVLAERFGVDRKRLATALLQAEAYQRAAQPQVASPIPETGTGVRAWAAACDRETEGGEEMPERAITRVAERFGFEMVDREELPGQPATCAPVPEKLHEEVRQALEGSYPSGLYAHQAKALEATIAGEDICLATSTASGKSLVFMAAAAHLVKRLRSGKVLALYPARALIQDQLDKWKALLEPLGLRLGYMDGGVPTDGRTAILRESHVVLMTPDVAHAWLMSNLRKPEVRSFLNALHLLILDEAHVYEGVFGTNMAYLLRRLQAVARPFRIISSTATVGEPEAFIRQLTGREARLFDLGDDRAARPDKTILLARPPAARHFEETVNLLRALSTEGVGRFLAFGDSRKMVELIVAAVNRAADGASAGEAEEEAAEEEGPGEWAAGAHRVMPYRAGYETEDRNAIQRALASGELVGVVSTSGLELGIDIGEIDLVVLLNVPPSRKAFRQRLGRAGRRSRGACLMIDTRGVLSHSPDALRKYLAQPLEPSWVYLDNRYIQYANALCAAAEWADAGRERVDVAPFASLPETFVRYVENELNPTESVPADLYSLKQRAQNGPHMEFPIRSAMERSFQIRGGFSMNLGTLSLPQVLREAYPGALYYYMARPHRVTQVSYRDGTIHARRDRFWTTRPLAQAMVFPNFDTGLYRLLRSERGFVAEASMQVSERVTGFVEQRGSTQEQHLYGTGSPYSQRPLTRFFETTGVCWCFPERCAVSEETAQRLLEAFCMEFGVQERDLGVGLFHARRSPTGAEGCQGICVFDATNGSLRLTERLGEQFSTVVTRALTNARALEDAQAETELRLLAGHVAGLRAVPVTAPEGTEAGTGNHDGGDNEEWQELIAPGEPAVNNPPQGSREIVKVLGHRYTPRGWYYDLEPHPPMDRWSVPTAQVQPIPGETRRLRVNAITGETEPLE